MALFEKPALTIDQQICLLQQRGLLISDEETARCTLSNISYYRFSAYTRPFYVPQQGDQHRFLPGTTFEQVQSLYSFDRELRLLLLDAIERLEVALRAQMTTTLAEHHGAHGYTDPGVFDDRYNHEWLLEKLTREMTASHADVFAQHYRMKYNEAPSCPPAWMAMELLTFKETSVLFSKLRHSADTQRISSYFGWPHRVLCSWFRSVSDLRNLCAHQSRVWNREFGSFPMISRRAPTNWAQISNDSRAASSPIDPQRRFYMQWVVIESLIRATYPESNWSKRLAQLLEQYTDVSLVNMGFSEGWRQQAFWQLAIENK
ncbi:MAG: Abi family protein [Cyanobacteria bacterium J06581_3]